MNDLNRKIIHIDLDAFFCAVEEKNNPELIGKPFAVGGNPEQRGVVSSCSYAARAFGVHSAMSMQRATIQCPILLVIPPHFRDYSKYSRMVMDKLHELSPFVEQISIDEAFIDVSAFTDSGESIGRKLQVTIVNDIGLPCSIGVATNKLVAKIATDKGKQSHQGIDPPNAITVVPAGTEKDFLAPMPVQNLWGIGPKTADRLENLGITKIGDLTTAPQHILTPVFGKTTHEMIKRACGIDSRPVFLSHEIKSISQETTFTRDISSMSVLKRTLLNLCETIGARLRDQKMYARTIKLKLRWANFKTISRQITLNVPTDQDRDIFHNAFSLLENVWKRDQLVRLIGVGVSNLDFPARQLSFWDNSSKKKQQLQVTLDEIRKKYGKKILQFGGDLESHDR